MPIEIRAVESTEVDDLIAADHRGFGQAPSKPDASRSWAEGELDRTRVAFEDGAIVGLSRAYSFELTMPGGALVPAAAVSWVAVLPTHRRRGVLTAMIAALHADARERSEPIAMLTASESLIYGRFGYGIATWRLGLSIERARARFAQPVNNTGRIRLLSREEGEKVLPSVYEQVRLVRPGMVSRPDFWWPAVYWGHIVSKDKANFIAVHEDANGAADGFVAYEMISDEWSGGLSQRKLMIWDFQTANPRTCAALWEYILGVDLVETVSATTLPVDDPLRHLISDPRRARVDFINDGLWIAPLDIPISLASRTYAIEGTLTIDVQGVERVTLDGGPDGATCAASTRDGDISCSRATVGACLLGGTRWGELAQAGLVEEHTPGAVARADLMFVSTPPAAMTSFF
ncbi:MAG: GNAT family N-acetyltransferase [Actinomycetota bacterium]